MKVLILDDVDISCTIMRLLIGQYIDREIPVRGFNNPNTFLEYVNSQEEPLLLVIDNHLLGFDILGEDILGKIDLGIKYRAILYSYWEPNDNIHKILSKGFDDVLSKDEPKEVLINCVKSLIKDIKLKYENQSYCEKMHKFVTCAYNEKLFTPKEE